MKILRRSGLLALAIVLGGAPLAHAVVIVDHRAGTILSRPGAIPPGVSFTTRADGPWTALPAALVLSGAGVAALVVGRRLRGRPTGGWRRRCQVSGLTAGLVAMTLCLAAPGPRPVWAQSDSCTSNDAGAPCFAGVSDILGGQRHLLRVDDLIVAGTRGDGGNEGNMFLWTWALQTTNSAVTTTLSTAVGQGVPNLVQNQVAVAIGRLFPPPVATTDVVATVGTIGSSQLRLLVTDFNGGTNILVNTTIPSSLPFGMVDFAAMADFTGDGIAELIVHNSSGSIRIATGTSNAGGPALTWGPEGNTGANANFQGGPLAAAFALGDFRGDGSQQIAMVRVDPNTFQGLVLTMFTVDPDTLAIADASSLPLPIPDASAFALAPSIAAGRFGSTTHDQLVLTYVFTEGSVTTKVITIDFDAALQPTMKAVLDLGVAYDISLVAAGRLSWFSSFDQAVIGLVSSSGSALDVFSFSTDGNLSITQVGGSSIQSQFPSCIYDVAVGNFDRTQVNPTPPPATEPNPNLQIAVVGATQCLSPDPLTVAIYNVDPQAGTSALASSTTVSGSGSPGTEAPVLLAGDTQGRSLPLGPAEKATVAAHIQPDTVLGVPPMHVDWITPAGGTAPTVLNVTVFPDTYNTQYNFAETSGTQATRKSTTSYTVATRESAQASVSYGIPGLDSVSVTVKTAAQQTHENSIAQTYNTYQGQSFSLTAATVFDDRIAATSTQMNIYSYQVLGQCTPDTGAPAQGGCPAGTRPLYVQFSGPDNVVYIDLAEGAAVEWYQPVHEPGNLLSYPGNLAQLQATLPVATPLQLLSASNTIWDSQSPEQVSIQWTQGGGSSVTSGSVSTHSFDTSVSVSGGANIEGFGVSASATFAYNQSAAVSTLNTASNTFSDSTGVVVNRGIPGGPTSSSNYLYAGQSFIFGETAPAGTIQDDLTLATAIQSQGFLSVGFAANPLSTGTIQSGDWWKQAYTAAADVALNHPQRWLQKAPTGTNPQQVWFNCPVGFSSSQTSPACTPNQDTPDPQNVAAADFYQMKGLFVTPGTSGDGPQITMANQGQTVTLKVRVYNYSLVGTPDGATVRVQFYAQPWDSVNGQFLSQPSNPSQFAPAVFIGEVQPGPIPGFCGGSGPDDPCSNPTAPSNWLFAQTTWDTSQVTAGTYWKFWVVVWMEQNGQLVSEIQDHGLTALPASPLGSLAAVPIEIYSNNLGFYNQTFFLAPPTSERPSRSASAPRQEGPALAIDRVELPPAPVPRDQPVAVRAHHRATGATFDSLLVLFYDGHPDQGAALFDVEVIPRLRADDRFVAPARFRPRACGVQQIFVRAIPLDGSAPAVTEAATLHVTADLKPEIASLQRAIGGATLAPSLRRQLLIIAQDAQRSVEEQNPLAAAAHLDRLRHLVSALGGHRVPGGTAMALLEQIDVIGACMPGAP